MHAVPVAASTSLASSLPSLDPIAEDMALIAGLLRGSEQHWREFHSRYDRLIYRCITKVTGRFGALLSQDDVREVYATLIVQLLSSDMHKLRTFDPARGNRFGSWIGLLAINAAYDYLRHVRREPHRAPISEAESLTSELPSPLETTICRERAERVSSVLARFSDKDREFVALYYGEGLDPDEIASRMNISVKTVYSKKHKIRGRLESMLASCRAAA